MQPQEVLMVDKLGPGHIVPIHRPRPVAGKGEERKPPQRQQKPDEEESPSEHDGLKGGHIDDHV